MAHQTQNKLIRDRVPEIIRESGRECDVEVLDEAAFRKALREKLMEEAEEVAATVTDNELVTELADLREVMETLIAAYGLDEEEIKLVQAQRRHERGGFQSRL